MGKKFFSLDSHPKFGGRRADLDPEQSGLLRISPKYKKNKELGDIFENQICELLKKNFPEDIVIGNIIFESGNYIDSLLLYESLQMDVVLVTSCGVICIEAKWISNDKYVRLSGSALAKSWALKTRHGTVNSEINGLKQNYRHIQFLEELFDKENLKCPVYQMTVIGSLEREKIKVQQFIDGNLVDVDEIVDRIEYIKKRNRFIHIDVNKVLAVLRDWECKLPGKEKLHIVYARNISTKKLPARCKKIMRSI